MITLKGDNLEKRETDYSLNYGTVKLSSDGNREFEFKSTEKVGSIITKVSCPGCTKASWVKIDDKTYTIKVYYKTSILGFINRKVMIYYTAEGNKNQEKITINLIGKVIKK